MLRCTDNQALTMLKNRIPSGKAVPAEMVDEEDLQDEDRLIVHLSSDWTDRLGNAC